MWSPLHLRYVSPPTYHDITAALGRCSRSGSSCCLCDLFASRFIETLVLPISLCIVWLQMTIEISVNNSFLTSSQLCSVIIANVPAPPVFVTSSFDVSQQAAFPGSPVGTLLATDIDRTLIVYVWCRRAQALNCHCYHCKRFVLCVLRESLL